MTANDNPITTKVEQQAPLTLTPVAYADASDNPCPKCGENVVVAYVGLRPHYALVRCFAGHVLGWARWPETQGGFNS
jgi:hypothetical protein